MTQKVITFIAVCIGLFILATVLIASGAPAILSTVALIGIFVAYKNIFGKKEEDENQDITLNK